MSTRTFEFGKLGKYEKALAENFKKAFREAAKVAASRAASALRAATEDAPPARVPRFRGAMHTLRLLHAWRVRVEMLGPTVVAISSVNRARNRARVEYAGFVEGGREAGVTAPSVWEDWKRDKSLPVKKRRPSEFTIWVRDKLNLPMADAIRAAWRISQNIKREGLNKRPIASRAFSGSPPLPAGSKSVPASFKSELYKALDREMVRAGYG